MPSGTTPNELKQRLSAGMLSFPLTDFDAQDEYDARASGQRLEWLTSFDSAAVFMAGGAGEFFSLSPAEYSAVISTGVAVAGPRLPVVAGVGYGTKLAITFAQEAERLGADGLLLMPPYLTEGSQAGLQTHIEAVCRATQLGVIVYNRANCQLSAPVVAAIAEQCPNLIGFKDGVGDMRQLAAIREKLGDRLVYLNGMPTAETYAQEFRNIGVPVYSSAIFNFVPRTALAFHRAANSGDLATVGQLMRDFLTPYVEIRKRQPGYAVSIVKAGARIVGRSAGHVRPPLSDLTSSEYDELAELIERLGPQD